MTVSYKNINIDDIKISPPKKHGGEYISDVNLTLQTPTVELRKDSILFHKEQFLKTLENIQDKIIKTVYENSFEFFGKKFSEKRIQTSLISFTGTSDDKFVLNNVINNTPFCNYDCTCILKIQVKYINKDIIVQFEIIHTKEAQQKLKDCILEDTPQVKTVIIPKPDDDAAFFE